MTEQLHDHELLLITASSQNTPIALRTFDRMLLAAKRLSPNHVAALDAQVRRQITALFPPGAVPPSPENDHQ